MPFQPRDGTGLGVVPCVGGNGATAPVMDGGLLGRAPAIVRARQQAALVARLRDPVVIQGETGTGKEVLARLIHRFGHAEASPFHTVTGPELADGMFQSQLFGHVKGAFSGASTNHGGSLATAAGGTLFIDELHLTPRHIQAALLRALQERRYSPVGSDITQVVTCRFIAAVQCPLKDLVDDGRLLADLRYRLGEFLIVLPPLRSRVEDLPALAANALRRRHDPYFKAFGNAPAEIAPDALVALVRSNWPGNVRELESVIAHGAATAANRGEQALTLGDLPERFQRFDSPLNPHQRQVVVEWYFSKGAPRFTRADVAAAMGVSPGTVDNDRRAISARVSEPEPRHGDGSSRCHDTAETSQRAATPESPDLALEPVLMRQVLRSS